MRLSVTSPRHSEWWRDLNRDAEKSGDPGVTLCEYQQNEPKVIVAVGADLISNQARIVSVIAGGAAYRWTTQVKNDAKSRSGSGRGTAPMATPIKLLSSALWAFVAPPIDERGCTLVKCFANLSKLR